MFHYILFSPTNIMFTKNRLNNENKIFSKILVMEFVLYCTHQIDNLQLFRSLVSWLDILVYGNSVKVE